MDLDMTNLEKHKFKVYLEQRKYEINLRLIARLIARLTTSIHAINRD